MQNRNPFKGSIYIVSASGPKPRRSILNYDLSLEELPLMKKCMKNFKELNFTEEEKRKLCLKTREHIQRYMTIDCRELLECAEELARKLSKMKEHDIVINAGDYGAYICLAAYCTGKLPRNKNISFQLWTVPLALFPKKLSKKTIVNSHNMNFHFDRESWIHPFKSLYSCQDLSEVHVRPGDIPQLRTLNAA